MAQVPLCKAPEGLFRQRYLPPFFETPTVDFLRVLALSRRLYARNAVIRGFRMDGTTSGLWTGVTPINVNRHWTVSRHPSGRVRNLRTVVWSHLSFPLFVGIPRCINLFRCAEMIVRYNVD